MYDIIQKVKKQTKKQQQREITSLLITVVQWYILLFTSQVKLLKTLLL